MNAPLNDFELAISTAYKIYGDEIRKLADEVDKGSKDIGEELDDITSEIKSFLGAKAANSVEESEAEEAIEQAEAWVTDNISNSITGRRIASAYVLLGRNEARIRLGEMDPKNEETETKTYQVQVEETRHYTMRYTIEASSEEEAIEKAENGESEDETVMRDNGTISRQNAIII